MASIQAPLLANNFTTNGRSASSMGSSPPKLSQKLFTRVALSYSIRDTFMLSTFVKLSSALTNKLFNISKYITHKNRSLSGSAKAGFAAMIAWHPSRNGKDVEFINVCAYFFENRLYNSDNWIVVSFKEPLLTAKPFAATSSASDRTDTANTINDKAVNMLLLNMWLPYRFADDGKCTRTAFSSVSIEYWPRSLAKYYGMRKKIHWNNQSINLNWNNDRSPHQTISFWTYCRRANIMRYSFRIECVASVWFRSSLTTDLAIWRLRDFHVGNHFFRMRDNNTVWSNYGIMMVAHMLRIEFAFGACQLYIHSCTHTCSVICLKLKGKKEKKCPLVHQQTQLSARKHSLPTYSSNFQIVFPYKVKIIAKDKNLCLLFRA